MKQTEATDYPLIKPACNLNLRTGNRTVIEYIGDRHVHLLGPNGGPIQVVRAGATNVINNLLSVVAPEDTGHRLVIYRGERYYEHNVSGVRTKIHRVRNEHFVEYNVNPYSQTKKVGHGAGHARQ